jgi:hypothetical protein
VATFSESLLWIPDYRWSTSLTLIFLIDLAQAGFGAQVLSGAVRFDVAVDGLFSWTMATQF